VPIISDEWRGLGDFFTPEREILIARSTHDVLTYLREIDDRELSQIAARARQRVLEHHTAEHRVRELEGHVHDLAGVRSVRRTGEWREGATLDTRAATV
jgi:spore maturation protein CgeB